MELLRLFALFFGTMAVAEGGLRFCYPTVAHYFWESLKYEQPLAPSRFRLRAIRVMATLEVFMGVVLLWAGTLH